jgi:Ca-activated chloride channel homolog
MSDDFDDIRRLMDRASPAPDPVRKAEALRRATAEFDRVQGSDLEARPTPERGWSARISEGVKTMLRTMTTGGGLAATTALVAVGMILVLPEGRALLAPPTPMQVAEEAEVLDREDAVPLSAQVRTEVPMVGSATDGGTRDQVASEEFAPAPPGSLALVPPAPMGAVATRERSVMMSGDAMILPLPVESGTESFATADDNPLKVTTEAPVSTFSIDVDTASWAVVRSSLMAGMLPPRDAVRVEEMVNYFPYAFPSPDGEHPFRPTVTVVPSPWNAGTELVHIGIQGTLPEVETRPPLNLVFLIDTSGSMQGADRLPLLKQSFRLMLAELRPEDEVAIVTYAGSAGLALEPTRASERATILAALDQLEAGGSTAGEAGLAQAYAVAETMAAEGEVSRILLATDGDFNVGLSDPQALKRYIAAKRESGVYLSVLGFGRGNLDDATMQALAQNGNGQAAYIDTLSEARKVLVDQLTGALFPIANDVKIQVEWNPAAVAEYRLIGYETRALRREDFNNDRVDAGDIGAGHSVTAIYEITPVGSEAVLTDALRYAPPRDATGSDELGFLRLRYKAPGEDDSRLIEMPILPGAGEAGDDVRFSVAVAGFGQLLRGSEYLGDWSWAEAIALANGAKGDDPFGYRAEAVTLMRLSESLSAN